MYPALSFDLLDGLKAGLTQHITTSITWAVEGIGFATDAHEVQTKAQKLLMQDDVDMVVGMMSRRMADTLNTLFTGANRLLLVLDLMGEFFLGLPPAPTMFFHSLQSCLSCRLAGRKAVESGAEGIIQAASFYDAGYLHGYAASQGVTTGGGHMVQYFVSSHIPAQANFQNLQAGLSSGQAQAVVALYAGDMARQFLEVYPTLTGRLPVWASPLALEEQMLTTVPYAMDGIRGFVPWSEHLDTEENRIFREAVQKRGRRPTLFSVLGYEGGLILANYLRLTDENNRDSPAVFNQLASLSFEGPRGQVAFDPATHFSFAPPYAATVIADNQGRCRLAALTPERTVEQDFRAFQTESPPTAYTGWHNTYLCI
ncbi:hypothetical protein GCM10023187_01510 [Nibrella viscosa]|uniref:Leucine-binding protein domain-containing protein n=1 Tax=Nibrella viscosa TaxID=1084524 RepID=A0ABP8JRE2_9BACT